MPRVTKVACKDCGTTLHKCNLKKHKQSESCQNRQLLNMVAKQNQELVSTVHTLRKEVQEISNRPQTVINHKHNHTTINQYIIANKKPLSLAGIEASVALGMQAAVLRDGAQGIAQYVVTENELPKKIYITDKSRNVAKYLEATRGEEIITDKGCEEILNRTFVKFGRDGEIVVDRLSDELEKYMTEQNEIGSWPDEFYENQMTKLGRLRLQWKKASEGHNNKLRKEVAKAIVRRCQL